MTTIEVRGPFSITACEDCSVQSECAAFALAQTVRENLLDRQAEAVKTRFDEAIDEIFNDLDEGSNIRSLMRARIALLRAQGLAKQAISVRTTITDIITGAVQAQLEPEAILDKQPDFMGDTLENLLVEHREGVGPLATAEELDAAGRDVRYYASTGVCGAIEVIESP